MHKQLMKKILAAILIISALAAGSVWYAGYHFSTVLVAFEKRSLEEDKQNLKIDSLADFGLEDPEEIEIQTGGPKPVTLKGWYFEHQYGRQADCGVVIAHGVSGTRYGGLKYTRPFRERNCSYIIYDARHHGESGGDYTTYGTYEADDMLAVVDVLKEKDSLTDERIGLVGESFGAATALIASSKREFGFTIADSPYSSLERIVTERGVTEYGDMILNIIPLAMSISASRADFDPYAVDITKAASEIKGPVLIFHSLQDDYTAPEHSKDIFAALTTGEKQLELTDWGATHGRSIDKEPRKYAAIVRKFMVMYF